MTLSRLYPIIDVKVCRACGLDPLRAAQECLAGGARIIQLRDKEGGSASTVALVDGLMQIAPEYDAQVIVNDRVDLALMSHADGVHVGQDDLPVPDVRRVAGPAMIVGLSTHTREQVDAALETAATYVAVGPVFGTRTKDTGYDARGLGLVTYSAGRGKPVVAIGGITLDNAARVIGAGADSVAVISDLVTCGDPKGRTRAFLAAVAG